MSDSGGFSVSVFLVIFLCMGRAAENDCGPLVLSREFKDWHSKWGNGFLAELGNGWSDLDDFLADHHEISILMKK